MLKVSWPPVRNIFIPEPGWVMFDLDLAGADAQVVAWDAGDEDLKDAFRNKLKIHIKNGCDVWGKEVMYAKDPKGKSEPHYTRIKRAVHLTNYGGQIPTLSKKCDMSTYESAMFQQKWLHELHPPIFEWHERTEFELKTTGRTTNKFGYSIDWFDRYSIPLRNQALAWKPQSTVAHVTEEAMIRFKRERENGNPYFQRKNARLSMNVHDSLVMQMRYECVQPVMSRFYELIHTIIIPYDDPLIIPWGIKRGRRSWGECQETTWEDVIGKEPERQELFELDRGVSQIH